MEIYNLQINHLTKPIGIDGENIQVSWNLRNGQYQTAYKIMVVTSNGIIVEETGKILSAHMYHDLDKSIPYRTKCNVVVRVWDEVGNVCSKEIELITGIDNKTWKAKWILPEETIRPKERQRASYLLKKFQLSKEQVALIGKEGIYIYATCHGLMNIYLNGSEITEYKLLPGTQQYDKRLMVWTFEVSQFIIEGENELVVTLGDGWYRGSMGNMQMKNVYGTDIALLLQMEIAGEVIVTTDRTWLASQEGALGFNDFMAGEEYDARKDFLSCLHEVKEKNFGYNNLILIDTLPICAHETFKAKLLITPKGEKVLDFGQNLVGYVSFSFEGEGGKSLILTHGEVLDKDGNFTIDNFCNARIPAKQEIKYICKDGKNTYYPTKTYMGFRYVKIEADFEINPDWFSAVAIYSDMRTTAQFSCGVPEVNQLFSNAMWSLKGNFIDVPTDCPTREKAGFSGDAQIYIHTAMYLMDCYAIYAKWIREQAAGQYKDGVVPQIAPKNTPPGKKAKLMGVMEIDGGVGWSDAFEIVPYRLYERYRDVSLLTEIYDSLKKWTAYEIKRAKKTRIVNRNELPKKHRKYMIDTGWMWGEWLEPNQNDAVYLKNLMLKGDSEVGTAFFYQHLICMGKIANALGQSSDENFYYDYAEKVKEAYRAVYTENGKIKEEKRQCRYVRPIAHNLLTEEEKRQAASELAKRIKENGNHLNTGFLSTHELCRVLCRYGQNETAYDLLLQRECPGWLYAVEKGCTTIPENWDCFDKEGNPVNSFNHYSYGAIAGWLMDSVCGICVENGEIMIQPHPDKRLRFAKAVYDSPFGRIVSEWKYKDGNYKYRVEVPTNMRARVILEGKKEVICTSGVWEF